MITIINGYDLETSFETIIKQVTPVLWQLPDRKSSLEINVPEVDGTYKDLLTPTFEARGLSFDCLTQGATVDDLRRNYFSLFQVLSSPGDYALYNDFLDMTINCFYLKQSGLTPIKKNPLKDGLAIEYTLQFGESNPLNNLPDYFLVDDINRFLVP